MKNLTMILAMLVLFSNSSRAGASKADWANSAYANVRVQKTEGDLTGVRIQLIKSQNSYYILYQSFEGEPLAPCLTSAKMQKNVYKVIFPASCIYKYSLNVSFKKEFAVVDFVEGADGFIDRKMVLPRIRHIP